MVETAVKERTNVIKDQQFSSTKISSLSFKDLTVMSQQNVNDSMYEPLLFCEDSTDWLNHIDSDIPELDVTFLDPPFNQGKYSQFLIPTPSRRTANSD